MDRSRNLGLTAEEVLKSRQEHGANLLTPPKKTSLWTLYLDKYRDPIIRILLIAATISLGLAFIERNFIETIGIFLAIFLATTVGFYFEVDASRKFCVLNALSEEQAVKVRRNGKVVEIPRHEVVVGDIVLVEVGDEIPADGEILCAMDLQVDESSLTGEPLSTKRARDEESGERSCESTYPPYMALRSTMVMNGRGELRVTAVGDATEIGHVAQKSTEQTSTKTPLSIQLGKLAKVISNAGATIATIALVCFLAHDILTDPLWKGSDYVLMAQRALGYFMMAVTLIVMAVPEGLPMAVTLALALNMRRMLKTNNLVRKLHACETMGAATVICTDKTGTLTENRMQVSKMSLVTSPRTPHPSPEILYAAISANSTAELDGDKGIGNPTEAALLLWMKGEGIDYMKVRAGLTVAFQMPFSTEKKYMLTVCSRDGQAYTFVKGAPEIVMAMCRMDEQTGEEVRAELLFHQQKAMRTLAFAYAEGDLSTGITPPTGMTLQAIAAIADPVRRDVPAAVAQCRNAGIEVKIVTGDIAATAVEIGRQIGIAGDTITGPEWAALSDDEAYCRSKKIKIMSRARPTDKQRLVEMLQRQGEVVAVTGDGTNDAPALHYAHVGLSLGSGTSVAKEASDMTLLDDSFGSIVNAVMWGRSFYKNIQRFLFFQLAVNVTALLLVLVASVVGTEMPLTVTQILWVNLVMDTFAALALASLPPSADVMKDKPRKQTDFIITREMSLTMAALGLVMFVLMFGFLLWCERRTEGVDLHELTLFFTTFVMLQFWNLFNAKALGENKSAFHHFLADKGMLLVLALIFAGQWLIVTFGGTMFRTTPLSLSEWLVIIASTSVVLWLGEIWRLIKRLKAK